MRTEFSAAPMVLRSREQSGSVWETSRNGWPAEETPFGALGAVLAGIGLQGLLAYTVARRVSEIGVRKLPPLAVGATGIIAAAVLVSYVPARRATRIDPIEALRHD